MKRIRPRRPDWAVWRPYDDERLAALIAEGLTLPRIAERMAPRFRARQVRRRIDDRYHGLQHARRARHREVYSAAQVAELFGWRKRRVLEWAAAGILPMGRATPADPWRLTLAELVRFLQDRRWWMLWEPRQLTNDHLQHVALLHRTACPHRWLTMADLAERFHVYHKVPADWCATGRLPAVLLMRRWYVWSADLDGWRPPMETHDRSAMMREVWARRREGRAA